MVGLEFRGSPLHCVLVFQFIQLECFQSCACAWCHNTKTSGNPVLLTASLVLCPVFLCCYSCTYTWSCCHIISTCAHSAWLKIATKVIIHFQVQGVARINWHTHPWQRATLLSNKAVRLSTAKVFVFSDSVLCLGKMHQYPASTDAWKRWEGDWFTTTSQYRELDRIDGEPADLKWKIFPGHTTLQILEKISEDDGRNEMWTWTIHGSNYLHVNV